MIVKLNAALTYAYNILCCICILARLNTCDNSCVANQLMFITLEQNMSRKQSLDAMDSDAEDKLIDESNIEDLVKELPQATDRTVQFLDNMLAMLPNR